MSNPGVTNQVMQWVEARLPIFSFINHSVGTEYPTPRNLNYWWSLGSIAGVALVLQIVTGIVLAMHYVPHADMAFESVEHIMRDVNYGWMMRYLHSNGASLFFVAVYIHMFRGLYFGSYKAPRELLWWFGILIFLAMMATAFMGYVLPWGQMSFWGATVITNMFTAIPIVGEAVTTWLWGGYSVAGPTLQRFFSLHYLLPFVIFALMFIHLWALHTSKSNNPLGIDVKSEKDTLPFHPYFTTKDLVGFGVFFIILAYWVFFNPNYMGHPDNYIPANPLVTPAHIVPEWYFLPFYAILRAVPDKLGGVALMLGAILILFVIPWLDTSRVRSATFRPIYSKFFWIFVVNGLILGWVGANPAEGSFILIGRIATAYYFAHFILVMPIVGWFEKPKPLPDSIAASVLGDDTAKEAK
ncbi:MAG: cytochrome b [Alphaproteobacteria bacterium]|nr:cytochrome b [Alphaproteobacteria bacterium]